jgi:hypothetical protein
MRGLALKESSVTIAGKDHPIEWGEVIQPTPEYEIKEYRFEDELGQEADGCLFVIKPGGSTRVARITDPKFRVEQIAIEGSGWLLVQNRGEPTQCLEVREPAAQNPVLSMGKDCSYCWIAGEAGLIVLNLNRPPFNLDAEIIVDADSSQLSSDFWDKFHELKRA